MKYSLSRRILHWSVFGLLVAQFPLGFYVAGFEPGRVAAADAALGEGGFSWLYNLHKTLGLSVLGLMVLRTVARATRPEPPYAQPLPGWQRTASSFVHVSLYVLLIVTPVVGWLGVSYYTAPAPFWFFGDVALPVAQDRALSEQLLYDVHAPLALLALLLIAVHVLAALKHWLVDKDRMIDRMI